MRNHRSYSSICVVPIDLFVVPVPCKQQALRGRERFGPETEVVPKRLALCVFRLTKASDVGGMQEGDLVHPGTKGHASRARILANICHFVDVGTAIKNRLYDLKGWFLDICVIVEQYTLKCGSRKSSLFENVIKRNRIIRGHP